MFHRLSLPAEAEWCGTCLILKLFPLWPLFLFSDPKEYILRNRTRHLNSFICLLSVCKTDQWWSGKWKVHWVSLAEAPFSLCIYSFYISKKLSKRWKLRAYFALIFFFFSPHFSFLSHHNHSPQTHVAGIRQVRIYTHRKDKGTVLLHDHYFRGPYESPRTIFRLQTWLENWCKPLKTRL